MMDDTMDDGLNERTADIDRVFSADNRHFLNKALWGPFVRTLVQGAPSTLVHAPTRARQNR